MSNRVDPFGSFGFKVKIDVLGLGEAEACFQEVSGLGVQVEVQDVVVGGLNNTTRKLMGAANYPNLVFKRGLCSKSMFSWLQGYINGNTKERISGTIQILGDDNQPAITYAFNNAIPVKWDGPQLSATQNAIAMESLELAHEGLTVS